MTPKITPDFASDFASDFAPESARELVQCTEQSSTPSGASSSEEPPRLSPKEEELIRKYVKLPKKSRGREIGFLELSPEAIAELRRRGYKPVLLPSLPRETRQEERRYLRLYIAAVMDRSVVPPREFGTTFMKAVSEWSGLTGKGEKGDEKKQKDVGREQAVEELLRWQGSRHTLDNSTLVVPREEKPVGKKL